MGDVGIVPAVSLQPHCRENYARGHPLASPAHNLDCVCSFVLTSATDVASASVDTASVIRVGGLPVAPQPVAAVSAALTMSALSLLCRQPLTHASSSLPIDPGWHGIDCAHRSASADALAPGLEKQGRPWIAPFVHNPAGQAFAAGATRKRPLIFV